MPIASNEEVKNIALTFFEQIERDARSGEITEVGEDAESLLGEADSEAEEWFKENDATAKMLDLTGEELSYLFSQKDNLNDNQKELLADVLNNSGLLENYSFLIDETELFNITAKAWAD